MSAAREPDRGADPGRAYSWLRAGIPLTLLLDLASPTGPDSPALAALEDEPGVAEWVPAPRAVPEGCPGGRS